MQTIAAHAHIVIYISYNSPQTFFHHSLYYLALSLDHHHDLFTETKQNLIKEEKMG